MKPIFLGISKQGDLEVIVHYFVLTVKRNQGEAGAKMQGGFYPQSPRSFLAVLEIISQTYLFLGFSLKISSATYFKGIQLYSILQNQSVNQPIIISVIHVLDLNCL